MKTKDKAKILEAAKEKQHITYKGNSNQDEYKFLERNNGSRKTVEKHL